MAINPILTSGGNGIAQSVKNIDSVAQETVGVSPGPSAGEGLSGNVGVPSTSFTLGPESADAVVELRVFQRQVQASAKVVATADAVIGFLIGTAPTGAY